MNKQNIKDVLEAEANISKFLDSWILTTFEHQILVRFLTNEFIGADFDDPETIKHLENRAKFYIEEFIK
ncbi:hypothetical protein ACXG0S_001999 [Campylobacter coli]